jgi:pimeloyl-ACP methyl ester carboxylesterase
MLRTTSLVLFSVLSIACAAGEVQRRDFYVVSDPGVRLFVREVTSASGKANGAPVLLVHGARVAGIGSFDLPVVNGSLAADLAQAGFRVYLLDVRGYGRSTRPAEFSQPPSANPPLVRSSAVVRDIAAVVRAIRSESGGQKVSVLGWATGGNWAGYYTSLHSPDVSHLIMLNALFGADAPHPMMGHGSDMEDPKHPGQLNPEIGAYMCGTAASLVRAWLKSIPLENKDEWRDPAVEKAYVDAAMASDPESSSHNPPCMRSPNGALEDSFYQATGRQLWDASMITVPTLVIAGERDFWSRPEDRDLLRRELVHAPRVQFTVIPNATHFVFLDRPEHGRQKFLEEVITFLKK